MIDVAVVAFAQTPMLRRAGQLNEVELVMPVVSQALSRAGLTIADIGFTCSGSSDYLAGVPFSFVGALDAVGAWPPIEESHVETDGAFALFEAWVRLQEGDIDTALVYAFGKSSSGPLRELLSLQLDPYVLGPLWPDSVSLAALQARSALDAGRFTEADMARVAARSRRDALGNPFAQIKRDDDPGVLLDEPYLVAPLRRHDCPPITDGAVAIVLASGAAASSASARPAFIRGIDHRIEPHELGARDLTVSVSTAEAARHAGVADGPVDVAELHAPFSHQELILRAALGLGADVVVNPSGGALAANPMMAAGLVRIGEAASRIWSGAASRVVAHATSGPCLQQNLVCVLEAGW
ncbi:MAG TPA: thiolase domain-containing protein [Acidimicrobiales bacterium]|nr:thiolase domain-containing protein [Acidimicrobiales bacterium]